MYTTAEGYVFHVTVLDLLPLTPPPFQSLKRKIKQMNMHSMIYSLSYPACCEYHITLNFLIDPTRRKSVALIIS